MPAAYLHPGRLRYSRRTRPSERSYQMSMHITAYPSLLILERAMWLFYPSRECLLTAHRFLTHHTNGKYNVTNGMVAVVDRLYVN